MKLKTPSTDDYITAMLVTFLVLACIAFILVMALLLSTQTDQIAASFGCCTGDLSTSACDCISTLRSYM